MNRTGLAGGLPIARRCRAPGTWPGRGRPERRAHARSRDREPRGAGPDRAEPGCPADRSRPADRGPPPMPPRRPRRRDGRLPGRRAGQQRTRTPARRPRHPPSARHARNGPARDRPARDRPARRRPPMPRPRRRPRQASRPSRAPAVRITAARRPRLSHRPTSLRTKPRPAGGARRPRARAAGVPPSPPGTRSCSVIRASPSNGGTRAVRRPGAVAARIRSGTGSRPASRGASSGGNRRARVTGA